MNGKAIPIIAVQELFDADTRRAIRENPRQYAIDKGMIAADSTVQVKIVVSGPGKMLIPILKMSISGTLENEQLRGVVAGFCSGSSNNNNTLSTICSTLYSHGCGA